jgi:hypothetical protein
MKYKLLLAALVYGSCISAQTNYVILDMQGIGSIKQAIKQEELEKIIGKKIPLTNPTDTISGSWVDSAIITYKTIPLSLTFQRQYYDSVNFWMMVTSIATSSKKVQTLKGIKIGSDKVTVINSYEFYPMDIYPEYDIDGKLTGATIINVYDNEQSTNLVFRLVKNKVVWIESGLTFEDGD